MEDLIIRPAARGDIAAVDALLARSYPKLLKPDYPPSVLVTALPIISRANPELIASGTYYVAELPDGQIAGAGGWTFSAPGQGRALSGRANVRHLVTDDRFTRRGIGKALMARIFKDATDAGALWMDCQATRTAVPFYMSVGFDLLNEINVVLSPGIHFPAVRMIKELK